jgi:hypothetical protein
MKRYYKERFRKSYHVAPSHWNALNGCLFAARSMRVSHPVATPVATLFRRGTKGSSCPAAASVVIRGSKQKELHNAINWGLGNSQIRLYNIWRQLKICAEERLDQWP